MDAPSFFAGSQKRAENANYGNMIYDFLVFKLDGFFPYSALCIRKFGAY
jgi:hypothetical protein